MALTAEAVLMNKDRRKEIEKAVAILREIAPKWEELKEIVGPVGEAEREYYDNMNENLQGGDKGQQADNAATQLEEVKNELDSCDLDDLITKLEEAAE
jgi:flagellar biosynthesis chaperone FliJ